MEIFIGVVAGGLITGYFSWRASKQLKQEAARLRQLTIVLMRILDGAEHIKVDAWDPETGEPKSYPQTIRLQPARSEGNIFPPTVTQGDPPAEDKGADVEQDSQ